MASILIVEDDPEINALMALTLRVEDYDVRQARDGRQALRMVEENPPDLILLDVMMPRLSGYELARLLQKNPQTRHIPLIFVTAKNEMEDRVRGLEMAIDYVCKPFAAPELIARVRAALRMSKLQEQLRNTNERLAQLATTDSLTGLCNRRHFYIELEDEIQRARRFAQPLSVVVFDLDFFKQINDSWGHSQGDRVLQEFSRVLENAKRSIDTVARLGGEEFAALLPATGFDGACSFAEKVRISTEQMSVTCRTFDGDEAPDLRVTVSAGAAVVARFDSVEDESVVANHALEIAPAEPSEAEPSEAEASETAPNVEVEIAENTTEETAIFSAEDDADATSNVVTSMTNGSATNSSTNAALRVLQDVETGHNLHDKNTKLSPLAQEFMKVADRLLYRSKATGRNRTSAEIIFCSPNLQLVPPDSVPVSEAARL